MPSDLRHALRSLGQAPAFSVAAVVTRGLGIGLNAAVFSAVHGVLLRPLEFPRPERLYTVWQNMEKRGGTRQDATGSAVFSDWRGRHSHLPAIAALWGEGAGPVALRA